ncbi:MAG: type VI secretion system baseplate subunit TssF/IglH [Francisellaceae bacterium]
MEIFETDHHIENLFEHIEKLKDELMQHFHHYADTVYHSRLRQYFPEMLMPVFNGGFVHVYDVKLSSDHDYIDRQQCLLMKDGTQFQRLYTLYDMSILPFHVEQVRYKEDRIELDFIAQNGVFRITNKCFRLWFLPSHFDPAELSFILNQLGKLKTATIETINIQGHKQRYIATVLQQRKDDLLTGRYIRQQLSDRRLFSFIDVESDMRQGGEIAGFTLTLDIEKAYFGYSENHDNAGFYTNLIPVINHKRAYCQDFIATGDRDVYWLHSNEDKAGESIVEVLAVYADGSRLSELDYQIIFDDRRCGIEFMDITTVLNQKIRALCGIAVGVDQKLMAKPRTLKLSWLHQTVSTYSLRLLNQFNVIDQHFCIEDLTSWLVLLESQKLFSWDLVYWRRLLNLTDKFSQIPISAHLQDVDYQAHEVVLYWSKLNSRMQAWILFYMSALEQFLAQHMSILRLEIRGVFQ